MYGACGEGVRKGCKAVDRHVHVVSGAGFIMHDQCVASYYDRVLQCKGCNVFMWACDDVRRGQASTEVRRILWDKGCGEIHFFRGLVMEWFIYSASGRVRAQPVVLFA